MLNGRYVEIFHEYERFAVVYQIKAFLSRPYACGDEFRLRGINFTLVKVALKFFSPLSFNAVRFSIASLLMLGFLWFRERSLRFKPKKS